MKFLKLLPAIFLLSTIVNAAPTASSTATVTSVTNGVIGQPVALSSHHHYYISNDTDAYVMFYMKTTLCPADHRAYCVTKNEQLGLAKGQHFTKDLDLTENFRYDAVGDHSIIATTEVTGGAASATLDQKYINVHY